MKIYFEQPVSKRKSALIRSAATFALKRLIADSTIFRNASVTFRLTRLSNSAETQLGGTTIENVSYSGHPNEFLVELDSGMDLTQLLLMVMHEMVHVKQFFTKELEETPDASTALWRATPYSEKDTDYWELPWEIEAYGREKGLFIRWIEAAGHTRKKWSMLAQ